MTFEQKKSPGHCPDGQQKRCGGAISAPSSSAYSLAAGYPASAITLYAVLAGHAVDGELMGAFPRDVQCGLSTGGRQEWWQVRPLL